MPKSKASQKYRRNRKRQQFEYRLNSVALLQAALPFYYNWYMANRGSALRRNWILKNMSRLDADLIRFDNTGTAEGWLKHFNTQRKKSQWYKERFTVLRQHLGDGVIAPTAVSAAVGQPATKHPERNKEILGRKMEDNDFAMQAAIRKADAYQRLKEEREEEREDNLALYVVSADEEIFRRYPDLKDLANHILFNKTEFDIPDLPFCDSALPFGGTTIYKSLQVGLGTKYFHFNFCTTTRALEEGEWHGYLTGGCRNGIFSHADEIDRTRLRENTLLHSGDYDIKWMPIFSYIGNNDNGRDCILLELESLCQSTFHNMFALEG